MGKNNRKAAKSKKEEKQAKNVMKWIFICLILLAAIMLIGYSYIN